MVLAAGAGSRLHPLTADLPKTLLPVTGEDEPEAGPRSILEITLANLAAVGLTDVVVVTGFAAARIEERVADLQRRYGVRLELVHNDKAQVWNNAYSLWCARDRFADGVLLVNGDTVHPPVVEERLLAARGPDVLLAVDREKPLAEEEMKVALTDAGLVRRITKQMDPATADGEYIGLTLIEPAAARPLAAALEATWRRDPSLYYEDGYQELVDRGGTVATAPISDPGHRVEWVEVDNFDDLARARQISGRIVEQAAQAASCRS